MILKGYSNKNIEAQRLCSLLSRVAQALFSFIRLFKQIKYRNAVRDEKRELYALDGNWEVMENGSNGLRAHPDFKSRNAPQVCRPVIL